MTLELRCADLGLACQAAIEADSEDDLIAKVAAHARDGHGVALNETLIDYARTQVRQR